MRCSENVCVHISESSEELPTDSRRHLAYTHTCNDTSYSQHTCTTVSVNDRRAEYCDERVCLSVCLSVYTHTCNDTSYSQHSCTTVSVITPPTIGERSIVMSVSVCLSVDLCVCLSVRDHLSVTTPAVFTKFFVRVTYGRGSVLL